ncbi:hypothetical protein ABLE93_14995 [Xanthobacter sp. KR7-65]|uniref:hypothetical protein n=1 Tax=Xanthobacter sp. KR7-65 TaxID=3156612 RepID=UPI0032B3BD2E
MREPRPLSRRGALLGAAALSLGATAAVISAAPVSDPVFAAIAEFRAKRSAFNAVLKIQEEHEARCSERGVSFCASSPEGDEIEERYNAACDADADAWWDFLNTTPTTRAGLLAYLDMLTDHDGYGGGPSPDADDFEAICTAIRTFVMAAGHA